MRSRFVSRTVAGGWKCRSEAVYVPEWETDDPHTLAAFERSCVDEIILVAIRAEGRGILQKEIVEGRRLSEGKTVVTGGKNGYDSVFAGLKAASGCDYVLIHDGAWPCVTEEIIRHRSRWSRAIWSLCL